MKAGSSAAALDPDERRARRQAGIGSALLAVTYYCGLGVVGKALDQHVGIFLEGAAAIPLVLLLVVGPAIGFGYLVTRRTGVRSVNPVFFGAFLALGVPLLAASILVMILEPSIEGAIILLSYTVALPAPIACLFLLGSKLALRLRREPKIARAEAKR